MVEKTMVDITRKSRRFRIAGSSTIDAALAAIVLLTTVLKVLVL